MLINTPDNFSLHHDFETHMREVFFKHKAFAFPLIFKNLTKFNRDIFLYFSSKEPEIYKALGEEKFLNIITHNVAKTFLNYKTSKKFFFLALTPFLSKNTTSKKHNQLISQFFNELSFLLSSALFIDYAKQNPDYQLFNIFDVNIYEPQLFSNKVKQYVQFTSIFSSLPHTPEIKYFIESNNTLKKHKEFILNTDASLFNILFNSYFKEWKQANNIMFDLSIVSLSSAPSPYIDQVYFIVKNFPAGEEHFQHLFDSFYNHLSSSFSLHLNNINPEKAHLEFFDKFNLYITPYLNNVVREKKLRHLILEQDELSIPHISITKSRSHTKKKI